MIDELPVIGVMQDVGTETPLAAYILTKDRRKIRNRSAMVENLALTASCGWFDRKISTGIGYQGLKPSFRNEGGNFLPWSPVQAQLNKKQKDSGMEMGKTKNHGTLG